MTCEDVVMKKITLTTALVALALVEGIAATQAALAQVTGLAPAALQQTLGHGNERGDCGRGDRDNDSDRC